MTSIQEMFDVKEQLSKNLNIPHMLALPKIQKIVINAGIGKQKEDNKAIEKIKNYVLIDEEFTIDNEMMTPSMKVRRFKVIEKYKKELDNLYH